MSKCTGDCGQPCYQCAPEAQGEKNPAVVSWNTAEVTGLSMAGQLPAPTTRSWTSTVLCFPTRQQRPHGQWASLDIADAERAQGFEPGHTEVGDEDRALQQLGVTYTAAQYLKKRFHCIGNAVYGPVRSLPQCQALLGVRTKALITCLLRA